MATQEVAKPQLLLALRQHFPRMSLRCMGDMLRGAKMLVVEPDNKEWPAKLAFGIPLDGMLYVRMDDEQRLVSPGEVFGINQYTLKGIDSSVSLRCTIKTVRYLAFSHNDIQSFGFARYNPKT